MKQKWWNWFINGWSYVLFGGFIPVDYYLLPKRYLKCTRFSPNDETICIIKEWFAKLELRIILWSFWNICKSRFIPKQAACNSKQIDNLTKITQTTTAHLRTPTALKYNRMLSISIICYSSSNYVSFKNKSFPNPFTADNILKPATNMTTPLQYYDLYSLE